MAPVPLMLIVVDINVCIIFDVEVQRSCVKLVFVLSLSLRCLYY